jgi:ATP synthase protein I
MQTQQPGIQRHILRGAATATGVLTPIVIGVAAAVGGRSAAVGASLGLVIVAAFFTISIVALARVPAPMLLPAALGVYAAKIVALGLSLSALRAAPFLDQLALGYAALAALLVWLAAELTLFRRAKILYVDPSAGR